MRGEEDQSETPTFFKSRSLDAEAPSQWMSLIPLPGQSRTIETRLPTGLQTNNRFPLASNRPGGVR